MADDMRSGKDCKQICNTRFYWITARNHLSIQIIVRLQTRIIQMNTLHQSLTVTNGNDELRGSSGADTIEGQDGYDTLYGGGGVAVPVDGNDYLFGNGGNDWIYGNGGDDYLRGGASVVTSSSFGLSGHDTIYGGLGHDTIYGDDGSDFLAGGGGFAHPQDDADFITGGLGDDLIVGNGGDDTIVGDIDAGAAGDDDIIYGGLGNDLIYGSGGLDAIAGQDGNDTLAGGVSDDLFFISSQGGQDVILDFEDTDTSRGLGTPTGPDDLLVIEKNINGTGIDTYAELMTHASVSNGSLVFDLGLGNKLTINNKTTLGPEDVLFSDEHDRIIAYDTLRGGEGTERRPDNYLLLGPDLDISNNPNVADNRNTYTEQKFNHIHVIDNVDSNVTGNTKVDILGFDAIGIHGMADKLAILSNIAGTGIDTLPELKAATHYSTEIDLFPTLRGEPLYSGLVINLSDKITVNLVGINSLDDINVEFFNHGDFLS
jgi:RTX calcium-binding nonapeptide repeat (4 copies)